MIEDHPLPWLAPLLNGVEHANFFEQRATEYSKGATKGDWNTVWSSFDKRQGAGKAANEEEAVDDGPDMFGEASGAGAATEAAE
jgi:ribonucleoside-diphosphate reductase beta chain